jgi:hypothetical protein
MKYRKVKVAERQSMTDIAMQEYQASEAVFTIYDDNVGVIIRDTTTCLVPGMELRIRENLDPTPELLAYKNRNHRVSTGDGVLPEFDAIGIGNMSIARPRTNISQPFRVQ